MKDIRGILMVSGGYAAAVIGAGFASGQEIVSYFVRYGRYGIVGIVIACAAFALFSYAVLSVCAESKVYSYADFLSLIFPNKLMQKAAMAAVFMCSAATLCVMTACAGEMGKITAGAHEIIGAALFTLLCGIVFFSDNRKITGVNSSLGLILTAGIIFTCFYILRFREHQTLAPYLNAAASGLTYAGYNVIGTGAVLSLSAGLLRDRREAAISSAASGVILFIMITLIWGVLSIYYGKINLGEIPMLTMALRQNKVIGMFYAVMLAAAVLTTGISSGCALIDILRRKIGDKAAVFVVLAFGFCASGAGFSYLIDKLYRLCGYIGGIIAVLILIKSAAMIKIKEK